MAPAGMKLHFLLLVFEIVTRGVDVHASRRERDASLSANIYTLAKTKGSLRLETIVKKRISSVEHLKVLQIEHLQHFLSYFFVLLIPAQTHFRFLSNLSKHPP
jgi:hypothetical protein